MTSPKQRLGHRIQLLRYSRGLSQREFAFSIGMDRAHLSGIESGKRNCSVTSLERIANGLGVNLEDLFKEVS